MLGAVAGYKESLVPVMQTLTYTFSCAAGVWERLVSVVLQAIQHPEANGEFVFNIRNFVTGGSLCIFWSLASVHP